MQIWSNIATGFAGCTFKLSSDLVMFLSTKDYGLPLMIFAFMAGVFAIMPFRWLNISVPEMYLLATESLSGLALASFADSEANVECEEKLVSL